jgi:hypothetical protein
VSEKSGRATVRFINARTSSGEEWAHHELRSEAVLYLGSDGKPVVEADDMATPMALRWVARHGQALMTWLRQQSWF